MSHHGINLLPGLIPVDRLAKLGKKRRLRRAVRAGEAQDIDEVSEFFLVDDGEEELYLDSAPETDTVRQALGWCSSGTMQTLLKVQEDR